MTRARLAHAATVAVVVGLSGCSGAATGVATREGGATTSATGAARAKSLVERPVVIGHRGAAGYRPEHTLASYELAARMGADAIEPDLVSTRDHVLVARHENEISQTTDVGDHPEFADHRTTKTIDGEAVTGWFTEDLTLAELRTLRAREPLPQVRPANRSYDGRFAVPTLAEILALRERLSKELGRQVGVVPEIKHPTYFAKAGLPLEPQLVSAVRAAGLDSATSGLMVQSFELGSLVRLRTEYGLKAPQVFLTQAKGAPYDLRASGDPRTYKDLLQPSSLRSLTKSVNVIGPEKTQVIRRRGDGSLGAPTSLVADAHDVGLKVMPYTFRAENQYLPRNLQTGPGAYDQGKAVEEQLAFLGAGIDGLFSDHPDLSVRAREEFTSRTPG